MNRSDVRPRTPRAALRLCALLLIGGIAAGCDMAGGESSVSAPTATLAPIVSMTPRATATPVPSLTPIPTDTLTPSTTPIPPTLTPSFTPSPTPPVIGVIASLQSVNVREGPGVDFGTLTVLRPGTGVEVLGTNADGSWLNIQMDDGTQGWISRALINLRDTPAPPPTGTPTPDQTLLAAGTPLPTSLFGGGTITPTPPRAVVTPTLAAATGVGTPPTNTGLQLPNIESINQTATALVGQLGAPPSSTPTISAGDGFGTPLPTPTISAGGVGATPTAGTGGVTTGTGQRARVFAYCDVPGDQYSPPTGLAAGSSLLVFWSWFAQTRAQVEDHIAAADYEVFLDGRRLEWRPFTGAIERRADGNYWVDWVVPTDALAAGQHRITYRVSWTAAISDGYDQFGPGTAIESQSGTCTFTVG
jgi:hypothetical protein